MRYGTKAFAEHPARNAAQNEIHARPIIPISTPSRVRRVVFLLERTPDAALLALSRFRSWCESQGLAAPPSDCRRFDIRIEDRQLSWELHNEFVTFTWLARADDRDGFPAALGLGCEAAAGSKVALAVRIDVMESAEIPERALVGFDGVHLCYASLEGGRAQIATDFVCDAEGFTRYEFAAGALGAHLRGIIVRRLLEIETYRVLALIGIPLSRQVAPQLTEMEARITGILSQLGLTAGSTLENQAALEKLNQLQIDADRLAGETRFRFAASRAYGRILARRLKSLDETPVGEHRTLSRYLRHRLDPALWTFEAVERRQSALVEQMTRTTAMLDARISLDIQVQNQRILAAISQTSTSQLNLQTTVEGLSTIAIAYYALGVLGYVLQGLDGLGGLHKTTVLAALVPLVLAAAWFGIRHIRHTHTKP